MSQTLSLSRQQAENAFSKAQSQFLARNRVFEEIDTIIQDREAKTARLREARLAKECEERAKASAPSSKRTKKA